MRTELIKVRQGWLVNVTLNQVLSQYFFKNSTKAKKFYSLLGGLA